MSQTLSATPTGRAAGPGFHLGMALTAVSVLLVSVIGCRLTGIQVPGVGGRILAAILVLAGFQAVPLYWHRKGRFALRDSTLTLLWAALLWIVLPFPVDLAARLGRAFPLRDTLFAHIDADMGVNIAAVSHWAAEHPVGHILNVSYALLTPLLILAFLATGLGGKATAVKRLLVGNLAAFAIGLPLFACLPAVGPGYGEHFAPDRGQAQCEAEVLLLREPGVYVLGRRE